MSHEQPTQPPDRTARVREAAGPVDRPSVPRARGPRGFEGKDAKRPRQRLLREATTQRAARRRL